jgi:RNA polymerase sigma factor (sigma-70 family)
MTGDANAFDRFVAHFRAKIFHYSWLMCGQREDAEDVAQETLLKVFESFDQLREPDRVRPWVFRIARNTCLMKRRKSVFAPSQELSLDDFVPAIDHHGGHARLQIADWSGLPDRQILHSEMKQVLDQAIGALPENYKSVILMRDVEELSTLETAHVLDLTQDVVKTRLHRARLAVRQKLDEYLRTGGPVLSSHTALGTVRAETESFLPISEGQSRFNTSPSGHPFDLYDNRKDLGNNGAPDGAAFCGRGFVQLTGRSNYTQYSVEIGQDLVANPALANDPVIASQLLARFLKDKENAIRGRWLLVICAQHAVWLTVALTA